MKDEDKDDDMIIEGKALAKIVKMLLESNHNYVALIKVLSSFAHETIGMVRDMRAVPYSSIEAMKEDLFKFPCVQGLRNNLKIKEIHEYNLEHPHDGEAAEKALIEIAEMFSEVDEDGK